MAGNRRVFLDGAQEDGRSALTKINGGERHDGAAVRRRARAFRPIRL